MCLCLAEDVESGIVIGWSLDGFFLLLDELVGAFVAGFSRLELRACGEEGL